MLQSTAIIFPTESAVAADFSYLDLYVLGEFH